MTYFGKWLIFGKWTVRAWRGGMVFWVPFPMHLALTGAQMSRGADEVKACAARLDWKAAQSIAEGLGRGDPQVLGVSGEAFFAGSLLCEGCWCNPGLARLSSWSQAYNIVSRNMGMRRALGKSPALKYEQFKGTSWVILPRAC